MIVGVESNFVLELTFRQEEAAEYLRILTLARQKAIQLVIPACALFEPYETLIRRTRERDAVGRELTKELQQMARTDIYTELGRTLEIVARALAESGKEQAQLLARTIDQIVDAATVIPLDAKMIKYSLAVQLAYRLPPQDAVVFASVDRFFEEWGQGRKLFANKNRKDFATVLVAGRLAKHNCKLLPKFTQAREYIESTLQR